MSSYIIESIILSSDESCQVGYNGIIKIEEHKAMGEGDKWYYDVYYEGGMRIRHFDFQAVKYKEQNQ